MGYQSAKMKKITDPENKLYTQITNAEQLSEILKQRTRKKRHSDFITYWLYQLPYSVVTALQ
jgi:hypothetical protein